jgi:hypothetical protein
MVNDCPTLRSVIEAPTSTESSSLFFTQQCDLVDTLLYFIYSILLSLRLLDELDNTLRIAGDFLAKKPTQKSYSL